MSDMIDRRLSEEQQLMRRSCRAFVNDFVIPFIRADWKREWLMANLRSHLGRDRARRFGTRRQASAELEGFGAAS